MVRWAPADLLPHTPYDLHVSVGHVFSAGRLFEHVRGSSQERHMHNGAGSHVRNHFARQENRVADGQCGWCYEPFGNEHAPRNHAGCAKWLRGACVRTLLI